MTINTADSKVEQKLDATVGLAQAQDTGNNEVAVQGDNEALVLRKSRQRKNIGIGIAILLIYGVIMAYMGHVIQRDWVGTRMAMTVTAELDAMALQLEEEQLARGGRYSHNLYAKKDVTSWDYYIKLTDNKKLLKEYNKNFDYDAYEDKYDRNFDRTKYENNKKSE